MRNRTDVLEPREPPLLAENARDDPWDDNLDPGRLDDAPAFLKYSGGTPITTSSVAQGQFATSALARGKLFPCSSSGCALFSLATRSFQNWLSTVLLIGPHDISADRCSGHAVRGRTRRGRFRPEAHRAFRLSPPACRTL